MGGQVARLRELSTDRQGEWVERLFARLSAMYGARFADMWSGLDMAKVKAAWAEDLGDLTLDEVTRGVSACKLRDWPPTLPEFLSLCRPSLDPESAFSEAVQQMALRDQGRDRWSHPAIYWAAVTIGAFDLRNMAWSAIKPRWSRVLQAELAKGEWPEVPPRLEALSAPGGTAPDPATVEAAIRKANSAFREAGDKQWALAYEAEAKAGKNLTMWQYKAAEVVLGRQLPRLSKAHRPDHADRAAGDDSFERDEEAVPL